MKMASEERWDCVEILSPLLKSVLSRYAQETAGNRNTPAIKGPDWAANLLVLQAWARKDEEDGD